MKVSVRNCVAILYGRPAEVKFWENDDLGSEMLFWGVPLRTMSFNSSTISIRKPCYGSEFNTPKKAHFEKGIFLTPKWSCPPIFQFRKRQFVHKCFVHNFRAP